jgi:AraC-like DNA-binding protein
MWGTGDIVMCKDHGIGGGIPSPITITYDDYPKIRAGNHDSTFQNKIENLEKMAAAACYDGKELAKMSKISVRQLQRIFRRQYGLSPQAWLDEQRLKISQKLLLSGRSVKMVALELRFKQVSHFCRRFKTYHHLTPSQFIEAGFKAGGVAHR